MQLDGMYRRMNGNIFLRRDTKPEFHRYLLRAVR